MSKVVATGAPLLMTMQAFAYAAQNTGAKGAKGSGPTSPKAPPQGRRTFRSRHRLASRRPKIR